MDSAKYVTQHKIIYINIGTKKEERIKSKMCYKIKCAIHYTVDLINNNINRDMQGTCKVKIISVYVHVLPKPHINVLYFKNENKKRVVLYFRKRKGSGV